MCKQDVMLAVKPTVVPNAHVYSSNKATWQPNASHESASLVYALCTCKWRNVYLELQLFLWAYNVWNGWHTDKIEVLSITTNMYIHTVVLYAFVNTTIITLFCYVVDNRSFPVVWNHASYDKSSYKRSNHTVIVLWTLYSRNPRYY